ncbi:hypothetical protein MNBD_GAMMA14-184 [hydrothermal vent metagenome]|uniref:Methyl-accepting chemotaxis protein n=1 Tax=hydrothermal vent metagenome TaxID=652676 RepID=A0A3B0YSI9_9ZZZZ
MQDATVSPIPRFVTAARLAGRLYGVLLTAKEISLSASNAKGIASRGGEKTAGFRPITDFITEMANDTISLVSRINQVALQISITSVSENRAVNACERFSKARDFLSDHGAQQSLSPVIQGLNNQIAEYQQQERTAIDSLGELFDDIEQRTRAAKIVVTNSRTEASRAAEFQPYLESIANSVENAAENIHTEIKVCRRYLSDLKEAIATP